MVIKSTPGDIPVAKNYKFFDKIIVENGFSLAEVRRIRKQVREHDVEWPGTVVNRAKDLMSAFVWSYSKQGQPYWSSIHKRSKGIVA